PTTQGRQGNVLTVLILQSEVGRDHTRGDRLTHVLARGVRRVGACSDAARLRRRARGIANGSPVPCGSRHLLGTTRRVPDHSEPMLTALVCDRPEVVAASATSVGDTCSSRPGFGVSTKIVAPSAMVVTVSIR